MRSRRTCGANRSTDEQGAECRRREGEVRCRAGAYSRLPRARGRPGGRIPRHQRNRRENRVPSCNAPRTHRRLPRRCARPAAGARALVQDAGNPSHGRTALQEGRTAAMDRADQRLREIHQAHRYPTSARAESRDGKALIRMNRKFALLLLQLGLLAVVIAVLPYKLFELDRYFVPKELVLHVVALLVTIVLLVRQRAFTVDLADQLLAVFVLWSVTSSALATNWWLAQRSLALAVSSALIFWAARRLASEDGMHRKLLFGAAIATVLAAIISLAQAYGAESDYFSLNRIPGGTFGNRNFVAHFGAIGLPAALYCAVTARSARGAMIGAISCAAVAATLVLTRSRAAWLAVGAAAFMSTIPLLAARRHLVGLNVGKRFVQVSGTMVLGLGLALVIPNRLNWNSDSPNLDSARGMMDYRTGSGKGRLAQYMHSMGMSIANPVFGVGPGNWPVEYVRFAPADDRSLADDGMTANPWPSSDWVAFVSERGVIPAAALMAAFGLLLLGAMRKWSLLADPDAVLARLVLIATIVRKLGV